eukprot:4450910-Pleurochrysis_carterae.AAC.1
MPMGAAAVATFDVAIGPRAGRNFARIIWRVARGIATFIAIARWRRLGTVVSACLFGDQGSAPRPVQLDIPADFASLEIAQHFAYRDQRERKITGRAFHHKFNIKYRVDRFAEPAHHRAELLSNERVAELSVGRE